MSSVCSTTEKKKEKKEETATKFCMLHLSHPYCGVTPTSVGEMAKFNALLKYVSLHLERSSGY
jgi:hypothetical protein